MASITKPATAATTQTTLHHNRVKPFRLLDGQLAGDRAPRADTDMTVDLAMLAWDGAVGQAGAKPLGTP